MQIYKRKGSSKWWVTWNDQNGKRFRKSSGTSDKKLAEALAAKWVEESFMEQHFGKIPEVPFDEALLNYAKAQKRDHPKHFNTVTRYQLRMLQAQFGGSDLSAITPMVIRSFLDARREQVMEATAQKSVSVLRAILYQAVEDNLLASVPKFPKLKSPKSRTRYLTVDEENRLIFHASQHLVPIIRLAVETGGRRSELLQLDWKYVNMENGRLTFIETKNGEDRTIKLSDRAFVVLSDLGPKRFGPVFTYKDRSIKCVRKAFANARAKADLEDVRFHDLRHTFASRLVQCGVPLYDVMTLMGHKSVSMVQRYAHLAPDFQDKAIGALNAFGHTLGTAEHRQTGKIRLSVWKNGAGDEIRTHDFNLGKVALYP